LLGEWWARRKDAEDARCSRLRCALAFASLTFALFLAAQFVPNIGTDFPVVVDDIVIGPLYGFPYMMFTSGSRQLQQWYVPAIADAVIVVYCVFFVGIFATWRYRYGRLRVHLLTIAASVIVLI